MGIKVDLKGKVFGRLTVIEDSGKKSGGKVVWTCECSCGEKTDVRGSHLKSGSIKSCGCIQSEVVKKMAEQNQKTKPTHRQNKWSKPTSSKYKGVSWVNRDSVWRSQISVGCRDISLGNFSNEIDAAKAYDKAARKYFGENCKLNFPNENEVGCLKEGDIV